MENLYTRLPTVLAFMIKDMTLNSNFSVIPLVGHIKLMVYLKF